jgi:thiamine-phosphate pyrophosphorylase
VTLCLVTDRRRLVPAGAPDEAAVRCLLAQIRYACAAGVDLIHVRERDLETSALAALVDAVLAAARGTSTRVVVNDRLDVAIACGADGVHLRADSVAVDAARRLGPPPFIIGRSVHGAGDIDRARGADYLIAGTVFPSESKPDSRALLGIDGLRAVVRASDVPVLAIGGLTIESMPEVAATGASGAAGIGLFMRERGAPGASCRACALEHIVAHARSRFDTAISRS